MNKVKKSANGDKSFTHFSKKYFILFLIFLFVFSVLAVYSLARPISTPKKTQLNIVREIAGLNFSTDKLPDGIRSINESIFVKSQKTLKVNVSNKVITDQDIEARGTYLISLELIADGSWSKTSIIQPRKSFSLRGKECSVLQSEFNIDIDKIYKDIETISNTIVGNRSSKYLLKIIPELEGNIYFQGKTIPLNKLGDFSFEVTDGQMNFLGEKNIEKDTPIEENSIIRNNINIFGLKIPVMVSRLIFSIAALLLLFLVLIMARIRKAESKNDLNEYKTINRKYGNRMVRIEQEIDLSNKVYLPLKSMKELVYISDEKDSLILEYHNTKENKVMFYLPDRDYVYGYEADNSSGIRLRSNFLGQKVQF